MSTVWQDNYTRFVTRRPDDTTAAVDEERARGFQLALGLIARGKPGRAHYEMQRSLRRQLLLSGIGELQLGPASTPHGVGSSPDMAWPPAQRQAGGVS